MTYIVIGVPDLDASSDEGGEQVEDKERRLDDDETRDEDGERTD